MDIALAVEKLLGAGVKFRRSDTYQALVDTWEDEQGVPTLEQLQTAWSQVQADQQAEADAATAQATRKQEAAANLSNFIAAETPLKTNYDNPAVISNAQKIAALNVMTNWNGQTTANKVDALYVAVCLLFIMVGYLIREKIK